MKSFLAPLLMAATAVAIPLEESKVLRARQFGNVGITENEFSRGGCRDIIFFFARGSGEIGNMGSTVGPPTGEGLKRAFGDSSVAVEGVDYAALLSTNFNPGGADPRGIRELEDLLTDAARRCPSSVLTVAGYSQGAALVHRAVEDLPASVKNRIAGAVTYGDTQNLQDLGRIPGFPRENTRVICNIGDLVCSGTLTILPPHLDYVRRVPEAVTFLTARIRDAQRGLGLQVTGRVITAAEVAKELGPAVEVTPAEAEAAKVEAAKLEVGMQQAAEEVDAEQ